MFDLYSMDDKSKKSSVLETTDEGVSNIHTMFDQLKVINSRFISADEVCELSSSLILENFDNKSSEKIEGRSEFKHFEDTNFNTNTNRVNGISNNTNTHLMKEILNTTKIEEITLPNKEQKEIKKNTKTHEVEYSFSVEPNSLMEKDINITQSLMDLTIKEDSEVYLQLIYKLFSELNNKISKLDKSKLLNKLLLENKMGNHKEVQNILEEETLDTENLLQKVCKNNLINKTHKLELQLNEYKDIQEIFLNNFKNILEMKLKEINKLKEEMSVYKKFIKKLNKQDMLESTFMQEYLKEDSKINNQSLKTENINLCKFVSEINLENEILNEKYKSELNKNRDLEKELLIFKSELYKLQVRYKKKTEIIDKQKKVLNVLTHKLSDN